MAQSAVAKTNLDGTILIEDATGVPLAHTVAYEEGDFSLEDLAFGLGATSGPSELLKFEDRGTFYAARKGARVYPKFKFSAHLTDVSDATDKLLLNAFLKTGAFAAGVSTLGASAEIWAVKITLTIEGSNHGDATDHTVVMNNCYGVCGISEGQPDMITVAGEVLGLITMT